MKQAILNRLALQALLIIALLGASLSTAISATRDEVVLYLNNGQGSAVAAFDENASLCWEETFTPYGDKQVLEDSFQRTGCGTVAEERGFTGHVEDNEIDLVYMQQRYYDPTIGRFISMDPVGLTVGDPRTLNRYSYAANNPYKYVDPTGELFFLAPAAPWVASAAVFAAKEVAAYALSEATNGASDILSASRMAKKGVVAAAKAIASNKKGANVLDSTVSVSDAPDGGVFRDANGRLRNADGTFAPDGGKKVNVSESTHGNTAGDQPATLYERYDADGNFLKHGISQDPSKRYSQKELAGGFLIERRTGTRREMLDMERNLVETNPGPLNKEPWAGSRSK